ncbi:Uma2 family endonuclease [Nocardioides sp. CF8]|uniref:Uma2 family endonuclease n=1 Tax=Nocardioides sp. CF8 TaxID=110319 RepID=UPI001E630B09|nr:Uma2 family endonuclease [Nocardioides sp. CF8]
MTLIPQSRPLTRADLDEMPDDGHRYELIDGVLMVTPSPRFGHQDALGRLHLLLAAACPADLVVVLAPFDVTLAEDTVMQPDLLVARFADITERDLPTVPLLAVEVASPSTRLFDLSTKKARLDEAGIEAYWVVDPEGPRLRVWERRDGQLVDVGDVVGEETFTTVVPFPVEITPARLSRSTPGT